MSARPITATVPLAVEDVQRVRHLLAHAEFCLQTVRQLLSGLLDAAEPQPEPKEEAPNA